MAFDPPSGLTGCPLQQRDTSAPNRLSRRSRLSQQAKRAAELDSPNSQQSNFKTPTRIPRSRVAAFSGESPLNDVDFQQDIIWDATSPSPNKLGNSGKKKPVGFVDISEIVNRIAPKHGRPKVAEPTLQQWIGDSATIPCTPDVPTTKLKKKSPRSNRVDNLLQLAKQFDFNMFSQDEKVEVQHQQRLELQSEDILDFEAGDQNDFSTLLPGNCQPLVRMEAGTHVQVNQHVEDDLDFLFDEPTQHVSGRLSQVLSTQPSQVKPASSTSFTEATEKLSTCSHGPAYGVSLTNSKGASANDEFEDDWENDHLLNDSLVLDITQNPQNFTVPKQCSTQKPSSEIKYYRESQVNIPICGQSAVSKAEKNNIGQRMTFKLESNSTFPAKRIQAVAWTNSSEAAQQNKFSSGTGISVEAVSQCTFQTSKTEKSVTQKPQFQQRTSVACSGAKYNMTAVSASNTSCPKNIQKTPIPNETSHTVEPAVSDFLDDEDLYSFFSSNLVWDNPADDNLLCEMCEDAENQIQSMENISTERTHLVSHKSNHTAVHQMANRTWDNGNQQLANEQLLSQIQTPPLASGGAVGRSLAATGARISRVTDSFMLIHTKSTSCSTNTSSYVHGNSHKEQFTFKNPNNSASAMTNKAVGKCSEAEIELKKQQAMERRRQRLQATHNLRAPT